ncbi:MAG: hypothetical protein WCW84_06740 [Sulfurimonas sp.]
MYSASLDKYFVSDPLEVDSGLACLFGFENQLSGAFDDYILCSKKFVREIQEDWWERDWAHVGNLQSSDIGIKTGEHICEGDFLKIGETIILEVRFENGCFVGYHTEEYAGVKNLRWGSLSRLCDADMRDIYETCNIVGNVFDGVRLESAGGK